MSTVLKKVAVVEKTAQAFNGPNLDDVRLTVSVELGRRAISLDDALNIGEQSLIELDKHVGDPMNIFLNGKLYARGEVVTVGENFGVRITEIMGEV